MSTCLAQHTDKTFSSRGGSLSLSRISNLFDCQSHFATQRFQTSSWIPHNDIPFESQQQMSNSGLRAG